MCQLIFYKKRKNQRNILFVRFCHFPRNYFYSVLFSFRLDTGIKESREPYFVSMECTLFE